MKPMNFLVVTTCLALSVAVFAAPKPKKGEISMKKAQEIASKEVSGKIKSQEYEFEKGQNVYSFDIEGQ